MKKIKRIAVTGHRGKIGQRLVALGAIPLECDVTDSFDVARAIGDIKPSVIIHAAAISGIDTCEKDPERANSVNAWGTNIVSEVAEKNGAKMVLLSSEQIFNGKWGNYKETSKPSPVNVYGLSKLAAEGIAALYDHKVLRLSRGVSQDDNDIRLALSGLAEAASFIKRSYCHLDFIAYAILQYVERIDEMPQVLNYAGKDHMSFYKLAKALNPATIKRASKESGYSPRPYNCGLNVSLATKLGLPMFSAKTTIERIHAGH